MRFSNLEWREGTILLANQGNSENTLGILGNYVEIFN